jgi:hypothetical protein
MKKIGFLFIAIAIVGLVSINACKSSIKPSQPAESMIQEKIDTLQQVADSVSDAMDTNDVVEE